MSFYRPPKPEADEPARARAPGAVTRMVVQKKNADRVSIYLDGAFAFGLYQDVLVQHGLRKGQMLSVTEQEAMLADDVRYHAKNVALGYLSHRARTRHEVRRKLAQAGVPEDAIEPTLDGLAARGYLDDEAYARQYAESRARVSGYGPQRIRQELMRRGVDRSTIESALADEIDRDDVRASAREQAEKKWRLLAREADPYKKRRKLSDFLVRRGFSYEVVQEIVESLNDDADA